MRKSRFSAAHMDGILKEVEMDATVQDETCRKHSVSEPTCYKWKRLCSDLTDSRLRQLQDVNAKLKHLYADLTLMHHALKDVTCTPPANPTKADAATSWSMRCGQVVASGPST